MAGFKVGYLVGSLATKSINRLLAKALVKVAPQELALTEIPFKDLPLYSYDFDNELPSGGDRIQGRHSRGGCRAVRDARVQPVNPRWTEKCHRLGEPALRQERVHTQTVRRHRNVARKDRHGCRAAASPQHSCVLQFATDEFHRSIYSVRGRHDHRGRPRFKRLNERVPPELHGGVPRFHRAGVHRVAAQYLGFWRWYIRLATVRISHRRSARLIVLRSQADASRAYRVSFPLIEHGSLPQRNIREVRSPGDDEPRHRRRQQHKRSDARNSNEGRQVTHLQRRRQSAGSPTREWTLWSRPAFA